MLKWTIMMVALVSVVSCATNEPTVVYSKPVCSPERAPEGLPFISDETLMLMGKEARDDVYEITDKLVRWARTNESIVEELCDS